MGWLGARARVKVRVRVGISNVGWAEGFGKETSMGGIHDERSALSDTQHISGSSDRCVTEYCHDECLQDTFMLRIHNDTVRTTA